MFCCQILTYTAFDFEDTLIYSCSLLAKLKMTRGGLTGQANLTWTEGLDTKGPGSVLDEKSYTDTRC